jgi:hypothetical protein
MLNEPSCADGGDEVLDFLVLERAVEAGLLDVEEFSAERQDGLRAAVAALLGRTARGVTLDNVQLGLRGVALRAVGEFAGQAAAGEGGFSNGFTRLARGLAGAGGVHGFLDDLAGERRVFIEILHDALVNDRGNDAFDLGVDELVLGLRAEARVGHLHRDDTDEAFPDVIAGKSGILVLEDLVGFGVLVDAACERGAETR